MIKTRVVSHCNLEPIFSPRLISLSLRSLTTVIEQMEQFSSRLGELSSRVESTHEHTAQGLEQGARRRDEQLRSTFFPSRARTQLGQETSCPAGVSVKVTLLLCSDAGASGAAAEGHGGGESVPQGDHRQDGRSARRAAAAAREGHCRVEPPRFRG